MAAAALALVSDTHQYKPACQADYLIISEVLRAVMVW